MFCRRPSSALAGAALTAFTAFAAWTCPSAVLAAPTTEPFGEIDGTSEFLFQDDANAPGAPLIRLYYIPSRTVIAHKNISLNARTGEADLSFTLRLTKSEALSVAETGLKTQAAAYYGVSVDKIQFLPLPLINSSTSFSRSADLVKDAVVPSDKTPTSAPLHFEVSYTKQGADNFKRNVVLGHGLFATYSAEARLLETATGEISTQALDIPLLLSDLPFCEVTAAGCGR